MELTEHDIAVLRALLKHGGWLSFSAIQAAVKHTGRETNAALVEGSLNSLKSASYIENRDREQSREYRLRPTQRSFVEMVIYDAMT